MSEPVTSRPKRQVRAKALTQSSQGVILHSIPYKETSLILELFTQSHGRVSVVAKGAKRPHSALRGVLLPFQRLDLSWSGAGELKTLTKAEWGGAPTPLTGSGALSGWYLNELILRLLPPEDAHEILYDVYLRCLCDLVTLDSPHACLRFFEWVLIQALGYGFEPLVTLTGESVSPDAWYVVIPGHGVEVYSQAWSNDHAIPGYALFDLAEDEFANPSTDKTLRRILRAQLDHYLQGRSLATRRIFRELQSYD